MLWAFGSSSVQCVEVCQRDLPRRSVRSVPTFPLARSGLQLFRHESLLELSGVPSVTCALSLGDAPEGWLPASRPWQAPCEVFTWSDSPEEEVGLCQCAVPLCQCDILPHCALCTRVPASLEVGRKGHGSVPREFFLPFTVVKWLKLLSSCRWIWVPWGCPALNHCIRAMQAALMWSVLGVSSNSTAGEWTGQRGFFPWDVTHGEKYHTCLPFPSAGSTQLIALPSQAAARGSAVSFLTRKLF